MSESGSSWPFGAHFGAGPQTNFNISVGLPPEAPGHPRRISDDDLRRTRQQFVDPRGMGEARAQISDTGTVLLAGPPGSGRIAAAKVLLYELDRDAQGIYREIRPDEKDDDEADLKDPALVGSADRLLLDLTGADVDCWQRSCRDLPTLRQNVGGQQAHLVVVLSEAQSRRLDPALRHGLVEIARPPALQVFRRHLRLGGVPAAEYLGEEPELDAFLTENPSMAEVALFADRVQRARRAADGRTGLKEWCEEARQARAEWREEAAAQVAELEETPQQRALLCTTALLHGAHLDVIHHADVSLRRMLGMPSPPGSTVLDGKDLAARLEKIEAAVDGEGRVRFRRLDFHLAVRAHLWDYLPDLRAPLEKWATDNLALRGRHVTPELLNGLVDGLSEQYLRTGARDNLDKLAGKWAQRQPDRAYVDAFCRALTRGLTDPRHAAYFRQVVLRWCCHQLSREMSEGLVRVCTDTIAPNHPDRAVVRLHHLARREGDSTTAAEALHELVATSGRLLRYLLDRLTRPNSHPADPALFLRVCAPHRLTAPGSAGRALADEKGVRDCVTAGWGRALDLPRLQWQPYAEHWLHSASSADPPYRARLLDLLVDAAARDGRKLARLYETARAAEPRDPGGPERAAETSDLLGRRISLSLGLHPPAAPTP